ncbi:MAG: PilN domain-containing protein [Acidobacteria bacterium]|nr:PilN domain-containing protein [Acidobacteriota bacterium]
MAVEIRGQDLILVCVRRGLRGYQLHSFKIINRYRELDPKLLNQELEAFAKGGGASKESLVLGVPRNKVVLRHLELPGGVEENLPHVIRYQVESLQPSDEELPYYDYAVMERKEGEERLSVLLAMIKRADLDETVQFLADLGFPPAAVQVSTTALYNALILGGGPVEDKIYLVLDLEDSSYEVILLRGGKILYSKEVSNLTTLPPVERLLEEMEVGLSRTRLEDQPVEKILLAGTASDRLMGDFKKLTEGCQFLHETMKIGQPGAFKPQLNSFVNAIGMALAELSRNHFMKLNLLPAERRLRRRPVNYIPTVVLAVAILLVLAGLLVRGMVQERKLLKQLQSQIAQLQPRVNQVKQLREQLQEVESKIGFLGSIHLGQEFQLELLREMTEILPNDVWLSNYMFSSSEVKINGLANSATEVITLVEKSPYFKEVKPLMAVTNDPSGKQRFYISAQLEKPAL